MARKRTPSTAEDPGLSASAAPAESITAETAGAEPAPAAPASAERAPAEPAVVAAPVHAEAAATPAEPAVPQADAPKPGDALIVYTPSWFEHEQQARDRLAAAESIVNSHALISAGAGFVPMPGLDLAAMSASQLWLLKRLSALYGVPFTEDLARKLVASLLSGFVPLQLAAPVASAVKMVPFVGSLLGGFSMVAVGGAVTYAIGRAFVQHFESGGTLLTFDPPRVRSFFEAEYRRRMAAVLTSPK